MTATSSLIDVDAVTKRYPSAKRAANVLALEDISFGVAEREVLCLLGPSGCGKSTILNIISGFDTPSSGSVLLSGKPISRPGPDRAVVFQSPALFPWLTVAENIAFPIRGRADLKDMLERRTIEYTNAVGLNGFEQHYPYQLSGGMRQRVALARALIGTPVVLLLDEPFGALDAQTRLVMHELLQRIWAVYHPTILFITHDVEEAIFLADRILVMTPRPGRIRAEFKVPIERPRHFQMLTRRQFVAIKEEILLLVHSVPDQPDALATSDVVTESSESSR
jgi:ABC-type nitrate/sulfonate/bicarbonate transport system ATPase subunit